MTPTRPLSRFFFFQAEDGIRDTSVTGVQTCALPIYDVPLLDPGFVGRAPRFHVVDDDAALELLAVRFRLIEVAHGDADVRAGAVEEQIGRASCRERVSTTVAAVSAVQYCLDKYIVP